MGMYVYSDGWHCVSSRALWQALVSWPAVLARATVRLLLWHNQPARPRRCQPRYKHQRGDKTLRGVLWCDLPWRDVVARDVILRHATTRRVTHVGLYVGGYVPRR